LPVDSSEEFPSSQGIVFVAKNVADDATAREELLAKTGRTAVPVITVDDEVIAGFDRGRLKRLLGLYPR
jgi:glutaredoxin 3